MGLFLTTIYDHFSTFYFKKKINALMLGLDAAGKTTILYKLNPIDKTDNKVTNIGSFLEFAEFNNNMTIRSWDLSESSFNKFLENRFFEETNALIYVIDTSQKERFKREKKHIDYLLNHKSLKSCPLLVIANKLDIAGQDAIIDVTNALGLTSLKDRFWHIQGACATTGEGLLEGFDWLVKTMNKRKQQR